jgi:hypothetical protein
MTETMIPVHRARFERLIRQFELEERRALWVRYNELGLDAALKLKKDFEDGRRADDRD